MASEDAIDYPALVTRALRGVVRDALSQAAREGLPGEHHFYITFRTQVEGVVMPEQLATRYPTEMTIVLQNQFWDLDVTPGSFSVSLRFGGPVERLTVPFDAVTVFADPAAELVFRFDGGSPQAVPPSADAAASADADTAADAAASAAPSDADASKVVDISAFRRRP